MSSGIFAEERVANISEIMPKLSEHVRIGDRITLGLEGDPKFPYSGSNRPTGDVVKVSKKDDGLVDLDVKLSSGDTVKLAAGSIAADQIWEFTEDSFRNVLERSINAQKVSSSDNDIESSYRGSLNESKEIVELRKALETQIKESNDFNQTVVKTLNEMAKDIINMNPNAKFCSVFASEYRGAMES